MSETDIEFDLRDGNEHGIQLEQEKQFSSNFGYKRLLVKPSEVLGSGSYGSVVKAQLDNVSCAAKILHNIFFTSADPNERDFTERYQLECRILQQLRHPCIVQFLGVVKDPRTLSSGRPILLMEMMEESLTHFLEKSQKPLHYHIQVNISHDIATALDYLHTNGILHRDLSSNNILMIGGVRAKLTDFGMSKMVDINPRMTRNQQTMCPGTLAFMPPEALLSKPTYSEKLDVFSMGVLLLQIITHKFPAPGDAYKIMNDPKYGRIQVPIPEMERRKNDLTSVFLAHPLRPIVLRCIKDTEDERPTASHLCQDLARLISTPEYSSCVSNYQQQVVALPPPLSAYDMREKEISLLNTQIVSLTKARDQVKGGVCSPKQDTTQLEADIVDLQKRRQLLIAEKEHEQEEEKEKLDYEYENAQFKEMMKNLEDKNKKYLLENAELKDCIEELKREKEASRLEHHKLCQQISELKQTVQSCLTFNNELHTGKAMKVVSTNYHQKSTSLPTLKLESIAGENDSTDIEQRILILKVLRLKISEFYQHFNATSIMQQMVDDKIIRPESKEEVISYREIYAQNMAATCEILSSRPKYPLAFLRRLCNTLKAKGNPKQLYLSTTLLYDFRHHISRNNPPIQILTTSPVISNFSDLQCHFLLMLQRVIKSFDSVPNSISIIKAFLRDLALPLGSEGKTVAIIDPSMYQRVKNTRKLFKKLSVLWNCFSPELLMMMCEECQCSSAIQAVEHFLMHHNTCANAVICQQKDIVGNQSSISSISSPLSALHLAYHTGPINNLQSQHPSVFKSLDEYRHVALWDTLRLTVQVDRPSTTLKDYDGITNSVCSYFEIPRASLVYGGCSQDGHIVCWLVSASLKTYLQKIMPGRSSCRLMAEEKILAVAAGNLMYRCLQMKEMELFEASFYGQTEVVQALLQQSVPVNTTDKDNWTALHLAAQEGNVDVIRLLGEAQAQVNVQTKDGRTPLYMASSKGHDAVVQMLVSLSADTNISNENGRTPLMTASFHGHYDIGRILIDAQAQINTQKKDGCTALHIAVQEGKVNVVRLLTKMQALVDIQSENYWTPLMIASFHGHADIVRILIEARADVNIQKKDGWTALHLAAKEDNIQVVRLLIDAQAQVNIQTKRGMMAIDIARSKEHEDIVDLLTQHSH